MRRRPAQVDRALADCGMIRHGNGAQPQRVEPTDAGGVLLRQAREATPRLLVEHLRKQAA